MIEAVGIVPVDKETYLSKSIVLTVGYACAEEYRHPAVDSDYRVIKDNLESLAEHPGFGAVFAVHNNYTVGLSTYRMLTIYDVINNYFAKKESLIASLERRMQHAETQNLAVLDEMFVLPEYQHHGIAKALLQESLRKISESSQQPTLVFSLIDNQNGAMEHITEEFSFEKSMLRNRSGEESHDVYWFKTLYPGQMTTPSSAILLPTE